LDSKEDEKNHRGHRDESQVTSGARSGFGYATLLLDLTTNPKLHWMFLTWGWQLPIFNLECRFENECVEVCFEIQNTRWYAHIFFDIVFVQIEINLQKDEEEFPSNHNLHHHALWQISTPPFLVNLVCRCY